MDTKQDVVNFHARLVISIKAFTNSKVRERDWLRARRRLALCGHKNYLV